MAEPNTNPDAAAASQDEITAEIGQLHQQYQQDVQRGGSEETTARLSFPPYRSSLLRHPTKSPITPTPKRSSCTAPPSASGMSTHWSPI